MALILVITAVTEDADALVGDGIDFGSRGVVTGEIGRGDVDLFMASKAALSGERDLALQLFLVSETMFVVVVCEYAIVGV